MNEHFKSYGPMTVGFDKLFRILEGIDSTARIPSFTSYPPYNIVKMDETKYAIQIAVAGFGEEDIDVIVEENTLTVTGKKQQADNNTYLHRGIATREFIRKFTLADTVEVRSADLVNGMLVIALENVIPESKKPRKIGVNEKATVQQPLKKELLQESKPFNYE